MQQHQDELADLNTHIPLDNKLHLIHHVIRRRYDFVDRISVALYDEELRTVKTFLASSGRDYPLEFYETPLEDAPSLQQIVKTSRPRVINDMSVFAQSEHEHTRRILEQGYRSSYTVPFYFNGKFLGFIFFDSYAANSFDENILNDLDVFAHLIAQIVGQEIANIRILLNAVRTANELIAAQKPTQAHLNRMAHYSRLIAQELAKSGKYDFTDADVERILWFSPVHVIVKRSTRNREFLNRLIQDLGYEAHRGIDILRKIAAFYQPDQEELPLEEIPIEARIAAVAAIFDSMTSLRTNTHAWSNEEAFAMLRRLSRTGVDQDCVEAFIKNSDRVEQIQASFQEETEYRS